MISMKTNPLTIAMLARTFVAITGQQVQDGEDMEGISPRQPVMVVETRSSVAAGVKIFENQEKKLGRV